LRGPVCHVLKPRSGAGTGVEEVDVGDGARVNLGVRYRTAPPKIAPLRQFLRLLELVRLNMREAGRLRDYELKRMRRRRRLRLCESLLARADRAGCGVTVSRLVAYPGFRNWLARVNLAHRVFSSHWLSPQTGEWFDAATSVGRSVRR
jgi:hypothetical protein